MAARTVSAMCLLVMLSCASTGQERTFCRLHPQAFAAAVLDPPRRWMAMCFFMVPSFFVDQNRRGTLLRLRRGRNRQHRKTARDLKQSEAVTWARARAVFIGEP